MFLDPRSNCCTFHVLFEDFPGIACPYYRTDIYYGFLEACLHPGCKRGQKECPNEYGMKESLAEKSAP